jgi:hypothetical protein
MPGVNLDVIIQPFKGPGEAVVHFFRTPSRQVAPPAAVDKERIPRDQSIPHVKTL